MSVSPSPYHISISTIWELVAVRLPLEIAEHAHVLDCEPCRAAFRACVRSKTLDEAKELSGANRAERQVAATFGKKRGMLRLVKSNRGRL